VSDRLFAAPACAPRSRRRARLAALALAIAAALGGVPAAAGSVSASAREPSAAPAAAAPVDATTGILEGIDVSHWQNTITWPSVAAAGKRFAIIKASESTTYVDPTYATNRAGAQAAGLWTGAYHFARPDATAGDALAEADHFAATITLGRGDLIPALDLEQAGGLSVAALQAWVTTWLGEVTKKVGIRPMIYTSPNFWKTYMGDSRALADAGYKTLWIAHWGVSAPTVPASNWGGHGWTFWQYSNCGTVPGIGGCVDLDRYNGTDLLPQAYSIFSLSAAASGQVKQGQTAATANVGIARTNFPSEVALAVSGLPAGSTAAFNTSPTTSASSGISVTTTAGVTPTGTFPLTITGTGQGLTRTTGVALVVADGLPPKIVALPTMSLRSGITVGPTLIRVYTTWGATDPSGIGSYALQQSNNGGTSWTTAVASTTGTAAWQWIPTSSVAIQRLRATDRAGNATAWTAGPRASVFITGQTGTAVAYTGAWSRYLNASALGGSLLFAKAAGASATYTFTGSSVGWVGTLGPSRGSAKVYLDGAYVKTVSLYSSTYKWRRIVFAQNWPTSTTHKLKIVVVGTAGHSIVDVDGFTWLWRH
jgi:GH25 family lysozyme M1 (1,4-beta-N-acetylmuramidase)